MTQPAPTPLPAASECELREVRRVRSERPAPAQEDVTCVDAVEVFRPPGTDFVQLSGGLLGELKRRLRLAEEREGARGSGVRERPTPHDGFSRNMRDTWTSPPSCAAEPERAVDLDPLSALHVEVEPPRTLEEWAEAISALPVVEIAVAPHSDNNFYGGFDAEHPDGVFLATYRDLPVGTPVYTVVHLPGGYRFRTPALVEFTRGPDAAGPGAPAGAGMRMCGLDVRMRGLIREFVRHRPAMFYVG